MIFNCELTPTIRSPFSIQLHFKLILLEQLARFISTPVGCFETCKEKTKYQKKLFYCNALPGPPAHYTPPPSSNNYHCGETKDSSDKRVRLSTG